MLPLNPMTLLFKAADLPLESSNLPFKAADLPLKSSNLPFTTTALHQPPGLLLSLNNAKIIQGR